MKPPKITIITVVYNGEATLERTIKSVTNQTYPNIEYIIIDGGSSDKTIEIINGYSKSISHWVSEPDKGIYDAMNKGIEAANGEWIYFLGSDDALYDNNVINSVFRNGVTAGIQFIYGNAISKSFKGKYDGPFSYKKLLKKNISHQAIFYSKDVFKTIGKYNTRYKLHADWDFNLSCFEKKINKKYTDIIIGEFGPGGVSSKHDECFLKESLIHRSILFLNETDHYRCIDIKNYDHYWRLIRNSGIRSVNELKKSAKGQPLPDFLSQIVESQIKISKKNLHIGFLSKTFMCVNFTRYLLQEKS